MVASVQGSCPISPAIHLLRPASRWMPPYGVTPRCPAAQDPQVRPCLQPPPAVRVTKGMTPSLLYRYMPAFQPMGDTSISVYFWLSLRLIAWLYGLRHHCHLGGSKPDCPRIHSARCKHRYDTLRERRAGEKKAGQRKTTEGPRDCCGVAVATASLSGLGLILQEP